GRAGRGGEEISGERLGDARIDAAGILTATANTWTPAQPYPLSVTSYKYVAAERAASPQRPLPWRASQILLYGAVKYEPDDVERIARYWEATPESMRREVCWSVLADPSGPTPGKERILILTRSLR